MTKDRLDAFGATGMVVFTLALAFNQVAIKLVNVGIQPVFAAGVRSVGAALILGLWMAWRGKRFDLARGSLWGGLLIGVFFTAEFLCIFNALDYTSVTHSVVIFYSMPIWLALIGHFVLPGERLTWRRSLGLCLALAGVSLAMTGQAGGAADWRGDLLALGASLSWTGIALVARLSGLRRVAPETQLMWQLGISSVALLALAPLFGPLIRDFAPVHLWGMAYQIVIIASGGFLFWMWTITVYPATAVAAFGLLTPVFGVGLGWAVLGEPLEPQVFAALVLVVAGLALVNRKPRRAQVPQKVLSTT